MTNIPLSSSKQISKQINHHILVVGAGGLTAPMLWSLLEAQDTLLDNTIITIVDPDVVELSNLNRQIFFTPKDLGQPKAEVLSNYFSLKKSSKITIRAITEEVSSKNIEKIAKGVTYIVDATDSVKTKFLLNDYSVLNDIPFCYAGVVGYSGLALAVKPQKSPCLRCVFGDVTEEEYQALGTSCKQAGIVGAAAGHVGFLQAHEVIQTLTNENYAPLLKKFDGKSLRYTETRISTDENCPLGCGAPRIRRVNLTDKKCPATFVYTKVALESFKQPTRAIFSYASEESSTNVTNSVTEEGYRVVGNPMRVGERIWHVVIDSNKEACR